MKMSVWILILPCFCVSVLDSEGEVGKEYPISFSLLYFHCIQEWSKNVILIELEKLYFFSIYLLPSMENSGDGSLSLFLVLRNVPG